MKLEVITPEKTIFKGEAEAVQLPGKDGLFQLLENHAPIISALNSGNIKVDLTENYIEDLDDGIPEELRVDSKNQKLIHIAVHGGVVEMLNNKVIVLAS